MLTERGKKLMEKWNWYVKKCEDEDKYESDFSIHEVSEYKDKKIYPLYGMGTFKITDTDIEALKNGKILYSTVNCGEYAIAIGIGSAIDELYSISDFSKGGFK